jgi:hypothetical protein
MKAERLVALAAFLTIAQGSLCVAQAQESDEAGAITARVHGTFQDRTGGLGVLSGDMMIARFEIRNGTLTAIGKIVGALADSTGDVLGQIDHELALAVANVTSTCNQLRMELGATDAELLKTPVRFDAQVAGFDSRDQAIPKALAVLCDAGELLRGKPTPASLAAALNGVVAAIRPRQKRF